MRNDIEWETKRLAEFKKKNADYVQPDVLKKITSQIKSIQALNEKVEGKAKEWKGLNKELTILKTNNAKLNKMKDNTIQEKEATLNSIKTKTAELKKTKEEREKILNENKVKLEDYRKEYPTYEL